MVPILSSHPEGVRPRLTDAQARPAADLPGKQEMEDQLDAMTDRIESLQAALGAEQRRSLLVVLQGRDACGKDGTTRRVFRKVNPALCTVTNFKRPSERELHHDYLWRVHQAVPARGMIGIFNRSHYEDVLVVRVHGLVAEAVWRKRFAQIRDFEAMLADEGMVIRKFFLHVSKEEQRKRLEERLDDPAKNWKFEAGDLGERALWDNYTEAYEEVLEKTSTPRNPWFIVPADRNRARDLMVAQVVLHTLEEMDPKYPPADPAVLAFRGGIV
ncbi:MAG TPA: PPK2 family polyphosphate kinase [Gemmatimonadales bacterium]|nr:PPK2 family polyphosphate kinase [Gemmatimonadales bacterium]